MKKTRVIIAGGGFAGPRDVRIMQNEPYAANQQTGNYVTCAVNDPRRALRWRGFRGGHAMMTHPPVARSFRLQRELSRVPRVRRRTTLFRFTWRWAQRKKNPRG